MTTYTWLNVALAIIALSLGLWHMRSNSPLFVAIRVGCLGLLIAVPWDFFSLEFGIVHYPDPGPIVFRIPLNDMVFTFLMTFICALASGPVSRSHKESARKEHQSQT